MSALRIAIPIFDRLTALDAVGPYEVLSRLPEAAVSFVAAEPGPKRTENGMLALTADLSFAELTDPEVVVVPGGFGTRALMHDEPTLAWLRGAHRSSQWTTSVCTGALLLAAAGSCTDSRRPPTGCRWTCSPSTERSRFRAGSSQQGKVITAAGVSAGIDMALTLAARIAGDEIAQAIQLGIEYDPQPPLQSGSLAVARPEIVAMVRAAQ